MIYIYCHNCLHYGGPNANQVSGSLQSSVTTSDVFLGPEVLIHKHKVCIANDRRWALIRLTSGVSAHNRPVGGFNGQRSLSKVSPFLVPTVDVTFGSVIFPGPYHGPGKKRATLRGLGG